MGIQSTELIAVLLSKSLTDRLATRKAGQIASMVFFPLYVPAKKIPFVAQFRKLKKIISSTLKTPRIINMVF